MSPSAALDVYSDAELAEERDFLLTSLADLDEERQAGDLDAHDFEVLRDGYTGRAAAVLRALDRRRVDQERPGAPSRAVARHADQAPGDGDVAGSRSELAEDEAEPDGSPGGMVAAAPDARWSGAKGRGSIGVGQVARGGAAGRLRRWRKPSIVVGVAAFAVLAGLGVAHGAGQRLPGDTVSGTVPGTKTQKLLQLAVQDFARRDLLGAIRAYDQVLATEPANVEALTYKGWLLRLAGSQGKDTTLIDRGLASMRQAEQVDPRYPDAHFFIGETLLRDKGDAGGAATEFEAYLADNPPVDMRSEVQNELRAARAAASAPPGSAAASTGPAPTTTAPGGNAPAP